MPFDIITIEPTVSDGAHGAGDVMFNLTSFTLPARACKLVKCFMQVAAGGGEDSTKIGVLFFKKNTQPTLGTLNATADISASDFVSNEFIGSTSLTLTDRGLLDRDLIDNVAIYYGGHNMTNELATTNFSFQTDPMILKSDKADYTMFVGAVFHAANSTDFDGTANVKLFLHVEY